MLYTRNLKNSIHTSSFKNEKEKKREKKRTKTVRYRKLNINQRAIPV